MISKAIVRPIARAIARAINGGRAFTWTLGYNGSDVFGQLTNAFSPTGANSTLEHVIFHEDGTAQQFLGPDTSAFDLSVSAIGVLTFNLITNVEINGSPATSGVTVVTTGYHTVTGDFDATADVKYIGALAGSSLFFKKQVHTTVFNDADTTSNSIRIDNRIQSAIQPTDFNIYNTLKPALGSELVTGGDFNNPSDWFVEGGGGSSWVIANSLATRISSLDFGLRQDLVRTVGLMYSLTLDIVEYTSGLLSVQLGGGAVSNFPASVGTHTLLLQWDGASAAMKLSNSFIGSIDNVSVKETNIIGTYQNGVYELLET